MTPVKLKGPDHSLVDEVTLTALCETVATHNSMVDVAGSTLNDSAVKRLVDEASAAVLVNHVEPKDDMVAERERASFDSRALSVHLNGGPAKVKRKCVAACNAPTPPRPPGDPLVSHPITPVLLSTGAPASRAELLEYLATQPWADKSKRYFQSRTEEYVNGLRTALGIW